MLSELAPNLKLEDLIQAINESLYMTLVSLFGSFILGISLGLLLYLTAQGGLLENKLIHFLTGAFVNTFRALPFIILILLVLPLTKFLLGSMRGPSAAIPALILGAAPFYARLVEIALKEVDKGVIEAAKSMGAGFYRIIFRVLLPESLPALISGLTVTAIALIGYTAMAGIIGAGGLGNYAYYFGFQRRDFTILLICSFFIVIIVFVFQLIGDFLAKRLDKR